jgi:hypothetical protein
MRLHHWIVVRCCCTPQKVFGFIRIPESLYRPGTLRLPVRSKVHAGPVSEADYPTDVLVEVKTLHRGPETELAVYSDDRPLEFWLDVAGFVEVAAEEPTAQYQRKFLSRMLSQKDDEIEQLRRKCEKLEQEVLSR